ncbi:siroheme synthase [Photobacterium sanctipauli]|uniref:precorrin-2 dehydrogenase n=1 Tax=Photobacterium sanctipauli TaxID=1342794 RepID=A0A2T3NVJ6_9GAMM|nr:siroheme synthase [Photobacterium sanctipauli]PSW20277.1 siroheme synthase [Photobacterium sanctipauli]
MDFFPIFLSLKNRKVVVIGGGEVACRKVDLLLKANAAITVVSPALHPYLNKLEKDNLISWTQKEYSPEDLADAHQVWATTDNSDLNKQIFNDAQARGLWTNVVDDPKHCHFITPSMIDRSPIQVAISSGGASPVLVRFLREKLETQLPQNLSLLASFAGEQRERIKQHYGTVDERRKFWEIFFRHPLVESAENEEMLESVFTALLKDQEQQLGGLYLIETGMDPELLSLKALRLMQQAEFVLYPERQNDIFVDLCRRDADREEYNESNLPVLVDKYLHEGLRVCVLSEKPQANDRFAALKGQHDHHYVPCL